MILKFFSNSFLNVYAKTCKVGLMICILASCGGGASGGTKSGTTLELPVPEQTTTNQSFQDAKKLFPGNVLAPQIIGKYVSSGYNSEDDTYPFVPDPDGNYYHFESFVTMGDSPWDIFEKYQETFTASSTLVPSKTISYDANNLRNEQRTEDGERGGGGNRSTTWCEGVKGYGIGECITMSVRTKAQIAGKEGEICFTEVMIVNGYAKNATVWKNNSRVKTLNLSINGEHWCTFQLKDVIYPQIFYLPDDLHIYPAKSGKKIPGRGAFKNALDDAYDEEGYDEKWPVYQTDLVFEILEVFPGEKYDDTCITGIALDVRGGVY